MLTKTLLEQIVPDFSFFEFLFLLEELHLDVVDSFGQSQQLLLVSKVLCLNWSRSQPFIVLCQNRLSVHHDFVLLSKLPVQLSDVLKLVLKLGILSLSRKVLLSDRRHLILVLSQEILNLFVLLLLRSFVCLTQLVNRVLKLHNLTFALHHCVLHLLRLLDQCLFKCRVSLVT